MSLALGDPAPPFALPAVGGEQVALSDLADRAAVAVVFSCNHCPYVRAWEDRLNDIAHDYEPRGVAVVAINSNDAASYPADSFDAMAERAREKGFAFPYAQDASQEVARAYGASRTPEVFLLDGARRLAYHGAIDDSTEPEAVRVPYLRQALDAVLSGQAPPAAETGVVGCTVKWRR
jgi:peroxiredoxin